MDSRNVTLKVYKMQILLQTPFGKPKLFREHSLMKLRNRPDDQFDWVLCDSCPGPSPHVVSLPNCYILFKLKLTETIREIVKWSVLFFITSIQMNKYLSRLDRHREQDSFHPETDRQSSGSRVHFEISELLINNLQSIGKLNIKSSSQL